MDEKVMTRGLNLRKAEGALRRAAHKAVHGTPEERSGRVLSSVISQAEYDPSSCTLVIRFVTGRRYRYANVPPELYEAFKNAPSKGAFFNIYIRDNFAYREVTG
jgi:hypothetical protein